MLGGLDMLVFAGGIVENAPTGHARNCDGQGFLGIELEKTKLGQRSHDFRAANGKQIFRDQLLDYKAYINKQSLDMSEIRKRQRNPDQT